MCVYIFSRYFVGFLVDIKNSKYLKAVISLLIMPKAHNDLCSDLKHSFKIQIHWTGTKLNIWSYFQNKLSTNSEYFLC